jgi:ADP-ribose pyrophosphatase YjhB (NUDIX family)
MYRNLIEEARKDGMQTICISALIRKNGQVLLIEDLKRQSALYELPSVQLGQNETISQAMQRAITEKTKMQLKKVISYLGHADRENERHYYFIAEVIDPYALEENTTIAYAWLDAQEAIGYPITEELREMLDLYCRM